MSDLEIAKELLERLEAGYRTLDEVYGFPETYLITLKRPHRDCLVRLLKKEIG